MFLVGHALMRTTNLNHLQFEPIAFPVIVEYLPQSDTTHAALETLRIEIERVDPTRQTYTLAFLVCYLIAW